MFTPVLSELLNFYELPITLPSPFSGQDTHGVFDFDFRNVQYPVTGEGFLMFKLDG